jgi:hypothetical protein
MDDIIQIKCPFDGAVLSVKYQVGIEEKNVTCPVCKNKYPFTKYKRVTPAAQMQEGATEYPHWKSQEEPATELPQENAIVGRLVSENPYISFQLKPGRNVIGRKSVNSKADCQVDTGESRMLSREHLVIEVKRVPTKGFVHYVSLYKEKVNKTYVENELLQYGDCLVLRHGDVLKLPDVTFKFELPDADATEI